jgi:hypothetical protein
MPHFWQKDDKTEKLTITHKLVYLLQDGTFNFFWNPNAKTFKEQIQSAQKNFSPNYLGAFDVYNFKNGTSEIGEIVSKLSYEKVWSMWSEHGGTGQGAWGLKFTSGDEEGNKQIILMSMLPQMIPNTPSDLRDIKLDRCIAHDWILISLSRLASVGNQKKKAESIIFIKQQIENNNLPQQDIETFLKIADKA